MRLTSESAIFNMGDTSIRVKQVVDVNKVILKELETFKKAGKYGRMIMRSRRSSTGNSLRKSCGWKMKKAQYYSRIL